MKILRHKHKNIFSQNKFYSTSTRIYLDPIYMLYFDTSTRINSKRHKQKNIARLKYKRYKHNEMKWQNLACKIEDFEVTKSKPTKQYTKCRPEICRATTTESSRRRRRRKNGRLRERQREGDPVETQPNPAKPSAHPVETQANPAWFGGRRGDRETGRSRVWGGISFWGKIRERERVALTQSKPSHPLPDLGADTERERETETMWVWRGRREI
jgi:hypothetical protein